MRPYSLLAVRVLVNKRLRRRLAQGDVSSGHDEEN